MWQPPDQLPTNRAVFLVRKWCAHDEGRTFCFIAKNPEEHIRAIGMPRLQFEPDVEAIIGKVEDGLFRDANGFLDKGFEIDAILAWAPIPPELLCEFDQAGVLAVELLSRVARPHTQGK